MHNMPQLREMPLIQGAELRSGLRRLIVLIFLLISVPLITASTSRRTESLTIRDKVQTVEIYDPAPDSHPQPFQVVVSAGDLGWIGLPVSIAEHLSALGYRVIGFNSRAYLSSFTERRTRLIPDELPGDLQTLLDWAASAEGYPSSFVLVGVSEGAGLNVVAAGQRPFAPRCKGIIALGTPWTTTLGWRWTDFPMWVTKKDPNEPLVDTEPYLRQVKVPIVMIHSTHDEWDSIDTAHQMFAQIPDPKKFVSIDANNHRFSDKMPEVMSSIESSLRWLENPAALQTP